VETLLNLVLLTSFFRPKCHGKHMPSTHPEPVSARRDEALRFLFERIDYERAVAVSYGTREFKLDRMRELLGRIGDPQERIRPIVHVAGTKGKGSVTTMVRTMLSAAGYRTGAFTSPHLERVEERLAIDAQPCSAEEFVRLIERVRPAVEAMDRAAAARPDPAADRPTYFEVTTALALLYFAERAVDAAVLEVGLGGRLDATNVCRTTVSIITSISLDHAAQLGDTLAEIAREKAGIIKPGVPVVSGVRGEEPREVIRAVCHERGAPLFELDREFHFTYRPPRGLESSGAEGVVDYQDVLGVRLDGLRLGLLGAHQAANAAVALAAMGLLASAGWAVSESAIREGLARAVCPARIELVSRRPALIVDGAHNRASAAALVAALGESFAVRRRRLLFATTLEKDVRGMLEELLPAFDEVVFTRYRDNPRGVDPAELARLAEAMTGRSYAVAPSAAVGWAELVGRAGPEDLVCATGSFFLAAEVRRLCEAANGSAG